MIDEKFDARTLANMTVALNRVCDESARGEEHRVRERVARQIIKSARSGKTTLGELVAAGRRALIGVVASTIPQSPHAVRRRAGLHRPSH
jgi:hypothetical protein